MTFENTAWAINGALLGSSLARRAEYAAVSGAQGIVQKGDLKVSQLAVPGIGVQIAPGVGLITNEYQTTPNETYVASNPGVHTIPAIEMPAANPSAKSYILAVVVGDPDFTQTGHPWMGSDDPPLGEEQSFQYVRPTLIEVAAGAKTLDVDYPALPLARLDIPANTTTVIDSYITDLRALARPRQEQQIFVSPAATWNNASPEYVPSGAGYANWGSPAFDVTVKVPSWAARAIVVTYVNGIRVGDNSVNIHGGIRTQLGPVSGAATIFDLEVQGGNGVERINLMAGGEYDVASIAGSERVIRVEGYQDTPASPTDNQRLRLQGGSQQIFDVRFFEE